jgi:hypothetical protein
MYQDFFNEARDGRRHRLELNRRNFDALHNRMDWSHKIEGQTQEFLPKTGVALEQFAALVEKSITGWKDWYMPVLGRSGRFPLSPEQCRSFLDALLDTTAINATETGPVQPIIVDGIKLGALGSLAIFKVYPKMQYPNDKGVFRICIEPVRQEDYYPDPTSRGLYRIHRSECDYYTVKHRADEGIYDADKVDELKSWFEQERQAQAAKDKGHSLSISPSVRRVVTIDEYWGDILDENGVCVMKNAYMTIANERFVLRPPQPNPFWHQKWPFVEIPLIRVPHSVWHRALFDGPVEINLTLNELWSLMIDGAIGSVWGTRQLKTDALENPEEVSAGVPQGKTLQIKSGVLAPGEKVMEDVTNGAVPAEALQMFQLLSSSFAESAMSNELRLGNFTGRSVKATEVVEASQAIGSLLEGIAKNVERGVGDLLYLVWMNAIQHIELIDPWLLIESLGPGPALFLMRTPPEARKEMFSSPISFRVSGMSALIGRTKDFQKMMALLQGIGANPILLMEFFKVYAPGSILAHLIKSLNIDPEQIKRDEKSLQGIPTELEQLAVFNQVVSPKAGQNPGQSPTTTGESSLPAEINQMTNPLTGIPASR